MTDQSTPDHPTSNQSPGEQRRERPDSYQPEDTDVVGDHRRASDDAVQSHRRRTQAGQTGSEHESTSRNVDDESEAEPTLDGLRGLIHAGVDQAMDVAESLFKMAGDLLGTVTTTARQTSSHRSESSSQSDSDHRETGLLLLAMNPGAPGSSVTGRMEVVNSTRDYLDAISPKCDVLVGTGGKSIPGHCVSFVPRIADVEPHSSQQFTVTIQIPDSAKRGAYSGLVTVTGHPAVRLLVHLDVN